MTQIELKPSLFSNVNIRQALYIAHVFNIVIMTIPQLLFCCVVSYWQWLEHYRHYRVTKLLRMLHQCCNTIVLGVLLIYVYSPSSAVHPWELCVYVSQISHDQCKILIMEHKISSAISININYVISITLACFSRFRLDKPKC